MKIMAFVILSVMASSSSFAQTGPTTSVPCKEIIARVQAAQKKTMGEQAKPADAGGEAPAATKAN